MSRLLTAAEIPWSGKAAQDVRSAPRPPSVLMAAHLGVVVRPALAPQHEQFLASSAIAPEVAAARGYRTVTELSEIRQLGFAKACSAPGLLIPVHGVDGTVRMHQCRPDCPRLDPKGRPRKYEFPWQSRQVLDVPPAVRDRIGDPGVPLFITEGARKADAAVSAGLNCISVRSLPFQR